MTEILVNSIFQVDDDSPIAKTCRVLHVDIEDDNIVVIDIFSRIALPEHWSLKQFNLELDEGNLRFLSVDPFPIKKKLTGKSLKRRNAAYELIQPIVEPDDGNDLAWLYPSTRGPLVNEAIKIWKIHHPNEKKKPSKVTVYNYLRRWAQRGLHPDALINDNLVNSGQRKDKQPRHITAKLGRTSSGGINKTPELEKKFRKGLEMFLLKKGERFDPKGHKVPHLIQAFEKIRRHAFRLGYENRDGKEVDVMPPDDELPSNAMFYKMWLEIPPLERAKWLYSECQRNKRHRNDKASARRAFAAGSIYQGDATIIDVTAVSLLDRRKIVKRFTLYLIIDVFSHMIVGFYISYEREQWFGYGLALANAAADKVEFCAEYGIEISPAKWPVPKNSICWAFYTDRGPAFSKASDEYVEQLRIRMTNAPPYRADLKGLVESLMEWMNKNVFDVCPGAVPEKTERGDPKYRLNARLNIHELTRLIIYAILYHNQKLLDDYPENLERLNQGVPKVPVKLWNYSIKNLGGRPRKRDAQELYESSLPKMRITLEPEGLKLKGLFFTSDWIEKYRLRDEAALPKFKRRRFTVAFDPRSTRKVFIRHDDGQYEPCYFVRKNQEEVFGNMSFFEVNTYFKAQEEIDEQYRPIERELSTEFNAMSDSIRRNAIAETEEALRDAPLSKTSRLDGAADQHNQDRDYLHRRNNTPTQDSAPAPANGTNTPKTPSSSNLVEPPKHGHLLRNIRDKRKANTQ